MAKKLDKRAKKFEEKKRKQFEKNKIGIKFDNKKLNWSLLPWREIERVVKVLDHGARKYDPYNWKYVVTEDRERYVAASMRHFVARQKGEIIDPDTGENHYANQICCLLFLLWKDIEDGKSK